MVSSAPTPVNPLAFNWCARFKVNCNEVSASYCDGVASSAFKCDVVFMGNVYIKVNIAQCTCINGTVRRDMTMLVRFNIVKGKTCGRVEWGSCLKVCVCDEESMACLTCSFSCISHERIVRHVGHVNPPSYS